MFTGCVAKKCYKNDSSVFNDSTLCSFVFVAIWLDRHRYRRNAVPRGSKLNLGLTLLELQIQGWSKRSQHHNKDQHHLRFQLHLQHHNTLQHHLRFQHHLRSQHHKKLKHNLRFQQHLLNFHQLKFQHQQHPKFHHHHRRHHDYLQLPNHGFFHPNHLPWKWRNKKRRLPTPAREPLQLCQVLPPAWLHQKLATRGAGMVMMMVS